MKRFLLSAIIAGLLLPAVFGKIINVPDLSQSAFENAYYNQSVPGDIIVLPAGTATWGNSSRPNQGVIYIITNVTVIGQGDSTVITLDNTGKTYANGVIAVWSAATFARMKIVGSNVNPVTAFQVSPFTVPTNASDAYAAPAAGVVFNGGFRLTDITYVGGTSDGYFAYISSGVNYGIIDNCRISGGTGSAELIFGRGPTNAWQTNAPLGGANNIFIENCTFGGSGYVCDANSNANFVVRFNTINGANKADGHGLASNTPPRSVRSMEIYNNQWTGGGISATAIEVRGGTAMIFDNTSSLAGAGDRFYLTEYGYQSTWANFGFSITSVTAGNPTTITTASPHGYTSGLPVVVFCPGTTPAIANAYNITVTSPTTFTIPFTTTVGGPQAAGTSNATTFTTPFVYPITDQVGVGKDPKVAASEPAYVWNNLKNGTPWSRSLNSVNSSAITTYRAQTSNPTATFTERDVIQANRDFFADAGFDTATGVSRGTKAAMLAFTPPITGYGWWVTDEGSWNKKLPDNTSGQLYTWTGSAWALKYTPYTYPHPSRLPIAPTNLIVNP